MCQNVCQLHVCPLARMSCRGVRAVARQQRSSWRACRLAPGWRRTEQGLDSMCFHYLQDGPHHALQVEARHLPLPRGRAARQPPGTPSRGGKCLGAPLCFGGKTIADFSFEIRVGLLFRSARRLQVFGSRALASFFEACRAVDTQTSH